MNFPVELPEKFLAMALETGLRPEDVEEHFIRGGGHGGQKINKTSSCAQLVHHPSGIEVRCQDHREQHLNRIDAWKHLILKLEDHVKGEQSQLAHERFTIRKQKQRRSRRAQEKMLEDKRHRGEIKEQRGPLL